MNVVLNACIDGANTAFAVNIGQRIVSTDVAISDGIYEAHKGVSPELVVLLFAYYRAGEWGRLSVGQQAILDFSENGVLLASFKQQLGVVNIENSRRHSAENAFSGKAVDQ